MVPLPAGSLLLDASSPPEPQIGAIEAFAIGKYEVTRAEFAIFVAETGHGSGDCQPGEIEFKWCNLPFLQTEQDPVVQIDWHDAIAYTRWLSRKTGKSYRLPTDKEWEYAASAGSSTDRYWRDRRTACQFGNIADLAFALAYGSSEVFECADGFPNTAPVGAFRPNAFGLHDMIGNAWEWTTGCSGGEECTLYFIRGGGWNTSPSHFRRGLRLDDDAAVFYVGFRVARSH